MSFYLYLMLYVICSPPLPESKLLTKLIRFPKGGPPIQKSSHNKDNDDKMAAEGSLYFEVYLEGQSDTRKIFLFSAYRTTPKDERAIFLLSRQSFHRQNMDLKTYQNDGIFACVR
jgi:hypothetical protein